MSSTVMESTPRRAALNRLFWRLHFWAGLIGAPIVLFAALTGLLYVFTPQIEAWRHGALDHVSIGQTLRPLDEQVAAVRKAYPNATLRFVVLDGLARPGILTGPDESLLRAAYEEVASR